MRTIFFFFFILLYSFSFSQKNIFIDKDFKQIDTTTYKLKCLKFNSKCFSISSKNSDTIINVIYNKYKFGKLNNSINKIVRKEIYGDNDNGLFIILHYVDTLNSYTSFMNHKISIVKKIREYYNYSDSINDKSIMKKHHISNSYEMHYKKIKKNNKKCIKKLKRLNTDLFHYYNRGNSNASPIKWVKDDTKILKNYFFKYYRQYYFLFLKPTGEYFLAGGLINPFQVKKLIKQSDWSAFKKDLIKSIQKNRRIGFFNAEHIHSCL